MSQRREVELGSTRLIAGRSTINFKVSAIEVSSFAQEMTEEDFKGYWREKVKSK